jgi:EAL domain-containing protein (putative c-di-GMP-specific phosphodiesterase class I)
MVTRRVSGVEALIRWNHPTQGVISPAELLPLAERTGTLSRLTDWVVDEAIATATAWRAIGHDARLAVNVSAVTLIDAALPARVAASLDRHGLDPRGLVVEVTEDAVMVDPQRCCEVLAELAAMGVGVSVDDFGTGQSSLAQLRRIGADELKIDRSFIIGMTEDRFDREVVVAVAGMGRRLGMRLVAEGVENTATWDALFDVGCDVAQGYGIARPMGRDKLLALLAEPAPLGATLRAA